MSMQDIARAKVEALAELRLRAQAPFSVPQGDLPAYYAETLNKVLAPVLGLLDEIAENAARWQHTAEALARDLDHEHNINGQLRDEVDAVREAVRRRDGWLGEKDAEIRRIQDELTAAGFAFDRATQRVNALQKGTLRGQRGSEAGCYG